MGNSSIVFFLLGLSLLLNFTQDLFWSYVYSLAESKIQNSLQLYPEQALNFIF